MHEWKFRHLPVAVLLSISLVAPLSFAQQGPVADSPAIEARVNEMLHKLTLDQKIDLIGGNGMMIRPEPAAGFPGLRMSDGPVGVRTGTVDTAYTAGIALAASWDPELAGRVGTAIGQDARARGINFVLGPGVNIYRMPMDGRNFEFFGEDPFLASRIAVGYIEGLQSQGVSATIKHYALNNQEWDRHNVSSDAGERTMREIYFPVFEAAVKEAHVGAVMNSYNLINGEHATQNNWLNNEVLKKEWGFQGILMSDWAATYDGIAAANGGLDLEMPHGDFMNRKTLLPAIQESKVSVDTIDDKVRRIFRTTLQFGFLDRPQENPAFSLYNQNGRQTALDEARESIVLLKNQNDLLPLDVNQYHTIAVIGPDAWPAVTGGGGSSQATPFDSVSILEGISRIPGVKVLYAPGLPSIRDIFQNTEFESRDGKPPITIETFNNGDFAGNPAVTYADAIDGWRTDVWTPGVPLTKSVRYTATYVPKTTGNYLFVAAATASDTYRLFVDDKQVMAQPAHESQAPQFIELPLTAGKPIQVRLDYPPDAPEPRIGFGIAAVSSLVSPEAKAIAAQADAVVVSVGYNSASEAEGFDRSWKLPFGQDALIKAIRAVNKNTIVTLTAGGGVDTRSWLDSVPAFLHNWYPGQEGGTALAEILFGLRSPEGKLPISFERSLEDNPAYDNYYAPASGETQHVRYAEGVFLGYRYYTSTQKRPLYPFGFGLTYSTFSFSNLHLSAKQVNPEDGVLISFDVTNTGHRDAADVAELYVGDPSAKIKRPAMELKGFSKVRLSPGQTKRVELQLNRRSLAYWDEAEHGWRVDPGAFRVFVGDSSENTPLQADFTVHD